MAKPKLYSRSDIFFSVIGEKHYSNETLYPKNTLTRIVSGGARAVQADNEYIFRAGDTILIPRNQLGRVTKYPVDGQPFKSISICYTQELLQKYYASHLAARVQPSSPKIKIFGQHPLLESLFSSLSPYFTLPDELPADIFAIKVEESISILRAIDSGVDSILGHFEEPGKIALADFMEKNYMFNMPAEKFGYLTGRSLSTFKKDFKSAFNTTPQKWLTQKRLELAHYHIFEKKRKPSDVYFEVGFENLSHFSFAFKKHFGYNPTNSRQPLNKAT